MNMYGRTLVCFSIFKVHMSFCVLVFYIAFLQCICVCTTEKRYVFAMFIDLESILPNAAESLHVYSASLVRNLAYGMQRNTR